MNGLCPHDQVVLQVLCAVVRRADLRTRPDGFRTEAARRQEVAALLSGAHEFAATFLGAPAVDVATELGRAAEALARASELEQAVRALLAAAGFQAAIAAAAIDPKVLQRVAEALDASALLGMGIDGGR